jgi:hypothetical protein
MLSIGKSTSLMSIVQRLPYTLNSFFNNSLLIGDSYGLRLIGRVPAGFDFWTRPLEGAEGPLRPFRTHPPEGFSPTSGGLAKIFVDGPQTLDFQ